MKPLLHRGLLAVVIGVVLGVSLSLAPAVPAGKHGGPEPLPQPASPLLAEVIEHIKRDYVDRVDDAMLMDAAIRGMISDLDPHSALLDPVEYSDIKVSTSGRYTGIGVELGVEGDRIVVIAPILGSPAARGGLQAGDVIYSIDGLGVAAVDLADTVNRMRGAPGTTVHLGIHRDGEMEPLSLELQRGEIQLESVHARRLDGGEMYVRISHFNDATARDLFQALAELRGGSGEAPPALVLDLRNNPGGVLDAAVAVADAFLDSGLIVSADGRMPEARFRIQAGPGDALHGAPMTVLVNHGSASAAEIVAAALRDNGRATLVGQRTFGKGSVQTIMPLSGGRAIRLTTSRYYTPSGRSINATGVIPDLVVTGEPHGEDAALAAAVEALQAQRSSTKAVIAAAERLRQ
jgi:carboxyl-terminal processing protease